MNILTFSPRFILSFDVEEFDTPLDYGKSLTMDEQMAVSHKGLLNILALLEKYNIKATFFTTANFALYYPDLLKKMSQTHEIASHGYYHTTFKEEDLRTSKEALEQLLGKEILGYRMARMAKLDEKAVADAGYKYNSSLHPTYLPGRYNNLSKPRTPFLLYDTWQIPASTTPYIRFPLFWLSFKNFPLWLIKWASNWILNFDKKKSKKYNNTPQVNFYFHPWEFTDVTDKEKFGLPFYVSRHSKQRMLEKLEQFIQWASKKGTFCTFEEEYKELRIRN